ncbi:heavy-metal-associated domain-containing protein [Thiobacillus sp.]|uniref:heavy-metal-associated domain-containing protein n=1 Tax=Thiobacillus sp. TaxID=924 RepID=UPI0025F9B587|nr:heavy-metal-associated domain-containing protein [Thiobacillus sp.]MBT9539963.1 heavy-metal-associated domain-containing protein [Thiobacillus sp.]MBT9540874.1 heavy-metal-associated domain-containing protein [Thiobacillus sp.]
MIQFQIQGMRCSGCANKITQAILKCDASAVVMADLESRCVSIASDLPAASLRNIISALGYHVGDPG